MSACAHAGWDGKTIFCPDCRKAPDVAALASVGFKGFTGTASINPKVEQFWETGDAEVFSRP